jgi:hypothetical protein
VDLVLVDLVVRPERGPQQRRLLRRLPDDLQRAVDALAIGPGTTMA